MGIWPLVIAIYLDLTDLITSAIGFHDIKSMKYLSLTKYYLLKFDFVTESNNYLNSIMNKLTAYPPNSLRLSAWKKIESLSR